MVRRKKGEREVEDYYLPVIYQFSLSLPSDRLGGQIFFPLFRCCMKKNKNTDNVIIFTLVTQRTPINQPAHSLPPPPVAPPPLSPPHHHLFRKDTLFLLMDEFSTGSPLQEYTTIATSSYHSSLSTHHRHHHYHQLPLQYKALFIGFLFSFVCVVVIHSNCSQWEEEKASGTEESSSLENVRKKERHSN